MKQVIERISLYLRYFLFKSDGHSLQAPFAFDFYKGVILKSKTDPVDREIETIRNELSNSNWTIQYYSFGENSKLDIRKRKKISHIVQRGISSSKKSRLFSRIIHEFGSKKIIELGTSVGINTAYLAKASPEGIVLTIEGHDELTRISQSVFQELGLQNIEVVRGNIDERMDFVVEYFDEIDFVFIDANHKSSAVTSYYDSLKQKFSNTTVVVIDDIRWSKDMFQGWKELVRSELVSHSFDLGDFGILIHKSTKIKQHYTLDF